MDIDPDTLGPEDLKALVAGRSDEEITAKANEIGVERILDRIFAEMPERFLPEKAGATRAQIQFTIDERPYQIRIADGTCTAGPGKVEEEKVGLKSSLPVFLKLITGEADGMMMVMTGRLRARGDIMFAPKVLGFFDRP